MSKTLSGLKVLNNLPEAGSTPGGKRSCGGCDVCQRDDAIENDPNFEYWPSHLIVEITNQCNLDCIMCERRFVQPDDLMSRETFDAIADRFFDFPIAIELSGLGEPTLAPMFPYAAGKVYEHGKVLYFPTNGAGLLKPSIAEALVDSDDTRVSISIDAATADTYGRVRVDKKGRPGDWQALVDTIVEFRRRFPNVRMLSCFTAGAYNVDEFPLFVEKALEWGLDEVAFKSVRCWDIPLEANSLRYQKDRTQEALFRAQELASQRDLPLKIEYPSYAEGYENAGMTPGFINYLDIIPLGINECQGSGTGGTGGTGGSSAATGTQTETGTSTAGIEGVSFTSIPEIIDIGIVVKSKKAKRVKPSAERKTVMTQEVMQILTDGSVTSCGAKHLIGHVSVDDFRSVVNEPSYQSHLLARHIGRPELSKFCRSCERMM